MYSATSRIVVPGPKTAATPASLERGHVVVRDDPADRDQHVVHALLLERRVIRGSSVMCAPDRIDSPTTSTSSWSAAVDDHLGRLAKAGVDDLEPLVTEAARQHLRAAVVPVEPGLGDEHLERSVGHGRRL